MLNSKNLVLLVDDDSVCNSINKIVLKKKNPQAEKNIFAFTNPLEAIKFFESAVREKSFENILVLLDINMPVMNGWEFLDEYAKFAPKDKSVIVFILTSSINESDMQKAQDNTLVEGFISKPLTPASVEKIFAAIESVRG